MYVGELGSNHMAERVWWVMLVLLKGRLDSILRAAKEGAVKIKSADNKSGL